jgi:hypothetical protein
MPPRPGIGRQPAGVANKPAAPAAPAIRRPAATSGTTPAPLARKLEKPATPRKSMVARPGLATGAGFRPPSLPAVRGGAPGAVPAVAPQAGLPSVAAPSLPVDAPRDPFTNTGDVFVPATPLPSRRGRRILLIVIALALTAAVIAFILMKIRPSGTVRGALHFEGLTKVAAADRSEFQSQQRLALGSPQVMQAARLNLGNQRIDPGFVGNDVAVNQVVSNAQWDEQSESLVLTYPGVAEPSDVKRMRSLLEAMQKAYVKANAANPATAPVDGDHPAADPKLEEYSRDIKGFKLKQAQFMEQAAMIADRRAAAATFKTKVDELFRVLGEARVRRQALDRDVERLKDSVLPASRPATQPGEAAPGDVEIARMELQLKILNDSMTAALKTKETQAGQAKAALDAAQRQFDVQVAAAKEAAAGDAALAAYVEGLTTLQANLRRLNEDLAQQQKDARDRLESLRKSLAKATADRLQRAWEADPELKALNETRALRERQYNAAIGQRDPGAEAVRAQLVEIELQIEVRRRAMIAADESNPLNQALSRFIDEGLGQMDQNRKRNEESVGALMAAAGKARPAVETLPANQQARARKLEEATQSLADARDAYSASLTQASDKAASEIRDLSTQIAAQQARIETRRKQLTEALASDPGLDDQLKEKRKALENAQAAEINVQKLYDEARDEQRQADNDAAKAELAQRSLPGIQQKLEELEQKKTQRLTQVAAEKRNPRDVVKVEEVRASAVSFIDEKDPRAMYAGLAAVGGVFLVLLAIAASRTPSETYIPPVMRDEAPHQETSHEGHVVYEGELVPDEIASAPPLVRDPFSIPAGQGTRPKRMLPI